MKLTENDSNTEKKDEKPETDIVKVDAKSASNPDFIMQNGNAQDLKKKLKRQKCVFRDGHENLPDSRITLHADFSQKIGSDKSHGNEIVVFFRKNNFYENVVEKIDEKISVYREIVKNLPETGYSKKNTIESGRTPTSILVDKIKSEHREFQISIVVPFGKDNNEILQEINMDNIIRTKTDGIINLIEHIYFNDRRPQNQNVRMSNIQKKYCEFYDGTIWKTIEEKTLIHNIIVYSKDIIDNYYEKKRKKLSKYYQTKYRTFSDLFDEIIIKKMNGNQKNEQYEKIYERTRILLINKKKIDHVKSEQNKLIITI